MTWMLAHPGRTITQFQISELFREAYGWSATVAVAVSNVFNNSDFVSLQDLENESYVESLQGTADRNLGYCQNICQSSPSLCSPAEDGVKKINLKDAAEILPIPGTSDNARTTLCTRFSCS
jgi:hypothetical protein